MSIMRRLIHRLLISEVLYMKEIKLKELVRFTGAKLLSNCDGFNFNDTDITNDLVHRFGLKA